MKACRLCLRGAFAQISATTFELTVQTAMHSYKEVWTPAIAKEFVVHQWQGNSHDKNHVS